LRLRLVAGKELEAVLVTVDQARHGAEIANHILYLGAVDQLLTIQYPAEQQAYDDEYNGNLYQGKTRLSLLQLVHLVLQCLSKVIWSNKHVSCQPELASTPAKAARTVDFSTLVSGVGLMKGLPDAFKKRRERLMIRAWSRS
jgi:hypothetical protein